MLVKTEFVAVVPQVYEVLLQINATIDQFVTVSADAEDLKKRAEMALNTSQYA